MKVGYGLHRLDVMLILLFVTVTGRGIVSVGKPIIKRVYLSLLPLLLSIKLDPIIVKSCASLNTSWFRGCCCGKCSFEHCFELVQLLHLQLKSMEYHSQSEVEGPKNVVKVSGANTVKVVVQGAAVVGWHLGEQEGM
jgi:hypothetical protein